MSHKNGIQASLPSIIAPALPNTMSLKFGSPARKTSAASDGGSPGGSKKTSHTDKNGNIDKSRNGLQMLLMGHECELGEDYPAYKRQSSEGEKNNGFDVLYHNMKHGQISVKSLQDLFRESATTEDVYAKHLTKLAKQAANSSPLGSFAPMFEVVKVMSEKLSSCHMDCVHKLHEIIKELAKYLEEQKNKHKQVKDELSGTADALHIIQTTTAAVNKSKEKYHQLCMETERLRRASAPNKEIEKAENKVKKSAEEYRAIVAKYATVRSDFEQKMTDSAKRFQEIEEAHLRHMKGVLDNYILSFENANVLINQVHQEFRRQVDEKTIASLIKQYSDTKGTGTEKPGLMVFEEWDPTTLVSIETSSTNGTLHEETQNPAPAKTRRPMALPFRRKKQRKSQKDMMNGSNTSKDTGTDKDGESIESPDKDPSVKIDEEGYTIRPETPKGSKNSWGMESSGSSDSDSDDYVSRKIHVKINPKDVTRTESGNNLDTLNAITRNLTLNSPTPVGGKRLSRRRSERTNRIKNTLSPPTRTFSQSSKSRSVPSTPVSSLVTPTSPMPKTTSENPSSFTPEDQSSEKRKAPVPPSSPPPGAVKVLPTIPSSKKSQEPQHPVPAPRRSSSKHLQPAENRFSTAFVPFTPPTHSGSPKHIPAIKPRQQFRNRAFVSDSDSQDDISARSRLSRSLDRLDEETGVEETGSPFKKKSFISSKPLKNSQEPTTPPEKVTLRKLVASSQFRPKSDPTLDATTQTHDPNSSPSTKWVNFDEAFSSTSPTSEGPPPLPIPKRKTLNYNSKKNKDSPAADKQEKSMSDELLELFGGGSMSSAPPPPRKNSSKADSILELYSTKPDSPATAAKKDHLTPTPIPQSSSNVSLNNLFIMPEKDAEIVTSSPATSNHNSDHLSPSHNSVDSIELNTPEQTERPRNLSLTTAWDDLGKANNSSHSAPLASSESWSSLSSIGGTPMDSFASSRGPSPLTLMHGDPIPIAVAFTETVNAYFKGSDETRCMVKITGEVQMSFPAGIVRAFTSNPNPATLSFKVKGVSNIKDFAPNANLIFADGSELSAESRSFFFNMSALVNHVKKMTEANPNSPYYNIQVMSYQLTPASGYDMVPLHVTSSWKCEKDSTDVIVDYKYNTKLHLPPLKNVQIIVPVDGGVTSVQSVPTANWMSAQNRLSWKMPVPVSSMSAPTHLKSKLSLSNGPSRASALAVQFMSDGATLTGADFELTGAGYRLSLVKRKFVSGKYLSDGS
uniref:F-BAR domain only protein 2 isoform X2 n=1 Tax=Ciona intestinalis TaxID=7719 RepID=UPI00089DB48A|nr:F-BAR domain only protein 2 isoform X2 [Ciona intestinalis]|eukprot:XP_018668431.1 F-BAR domain only protein 2 isoform X2 [Ciona intestinalis]